MKYQLLILILLVCGMAAGQTTKPPRTMAVTIDDLPYVTVDAAYLPNAQRATNEILRVLRKHQAPVVGFVNEERLTTGAERNARIKLLKQWVDMGAILGNHTFSHQDLNQLTIAEFENEIVKGDVVTRQLMQIRQPYQLYFRHPMTHTGDTQDKKEAIEKFLAARGYKITPHTIENSDFIFNAAYATALHQKDLASAKRLRDAYLDFSTAATEFAEKISPQIFGREIPQVLLIHANDINADALDDLLTRFEARGYRFASLDQVMKEPAYETRDSWVGKTGPTWLFRWARSKGLKISFAADPDPPQWVMDLYNRR
jgi:peptidoglycan/xylan/chitin deacetylase (PgdA/CDA1 family)